MSAGQEIDYAPPPPWHRRRNVRKWAWLGTGLVLLFCALLSVPWCYRRVHLIWLQELCLGYAAPASQVVREDDPAKIGLLAHDRRYVSTSPDVTGLTVSCWEQLYAELSPPGGRQMPVVFLHERRTHARTRLLAVIAGRGDPFRLFAFVVDPGNFLSPPRLLTTDWTFTPAFDGNVRLYAGQPDPLDPRHFTITYERNGVPGTIDGWLHDDSVVLECRR